ncbi:LysR family transcriptional regulator [Hydrogenimonas cancrithermarum]|uniref:LysR family transcriptional regulator n=1 Tax=Hydrogenimonas cancrithermarum TaxID=2993563 RepID=A0ABN6WXJ7_9BACT|nr:LysR family transcriptional regulator [Hydrogenimonas cancrithermarum]BDY13373.1 LysR family transcriptional regulator [Hydrogenimonas cancrithermarum]
MLKDFAKLETFLTVVRERSFSKASAKLGISQPAVTQQIKFIEKYLDCKIIERKKNGVILTKEGEDLYRIALRLEKCINNAERDLIKIINKEITFRIGASFTIGNFIIPGKCLNNIKNVIHNDVQIKVEVSEQVIDDILTKQIDLGLIESPIFKDDVIYREWLEDELVIFSNQPLPKTLKPEDLNNYRWICRDEASHTRRMVKEVFEEIGTECKNLDVLYEVDSSATLKAAILKAETNEGEPPVVSFISHVAIADEVENGQLYESRIRGYRIKRKLYIAYSKDRKHDAFIENVVNFLQQNKC